MTDPDPPVDWGADFISLAEPRTYNPVAEASRRLAIAFAQQIDVAVPAALETLGLSLPDALPRLTRQDQGLRCTVLLDGQPLVEFDPPQWERSADGRVATVTINSRTCDPAGSPRATQPD